MVSRAATTSMLVLRIVTLAASAVAIALLVTNHVKFDDGSKLRFQDFKSFRYEVVAAAIAGAYCVVQLPFAIYYAVQQKRLIRNGFLPEFDFFGDKIATLLLGTGVGVGFGVSVQFKNFFDDLFDALGVQKDDATRSTYEKFFNRAIVATAILTVAFASMAVVSLISSISRSKSKGIFG